jgi:protein gp37
MGIKTKIDWCDSSWNPVTGCLHGCEYCYARNIAKRFSCEGQTLDAPAELQRVWLEDGGADLRQKGCHVLRYPVRLLDSGRICPYPFAFAPTLHRYKLNEPQKWKKPRTIFVCSMADLFGEWVPDGWIDDVIRASQHAQQHRYLFLTKNPERYDEWLERFEESKIPGLDEIQNCWFGASATNNEQLERANRSRAMWLSIEPIKEHIQTDEDQFMEFIPTPAGELERPRWAWVVIGAETGNSKDKVKPEKEWIDDIVGACDCYKTPVFMKESLRQLMGADFRQEFPWEVTTWQ